MALLIGFNNGFQMCLLWVLRGFIRILIVVLEDILTFQLFGMLTAKDSVLSILNSN